MICTRFHRRNRPPPSALHLLPLVLPLLGLAAAQVTPPDTVHVPLTFSGDGKYIASVNMSDGAQTQRFSLALSATTPWTVVANASCASCGAAGVPTYNPAQSSSAKALAGGSQAVAVAGGLVDAGAGTLSKEDCALHEANGSFWMYPNQTLVQVAQSPVLERGVSGLIGLGLSASRPLDSVFGQWLAQHPGQQNVSFGLALNAPASQAVAPATGDSGDAGELHMLKPDASAYQGPVTFAPVQQGVSQAPPSSASSTTSSSSAAASPSASASASMMNSNDSSWVIALQGWDFTAPGGSARASNAGGGLAVLEPFFASVVYPAAQAAQLYASFSGASAIPSASDASSVQYAVPCDAAQDKSLELGVTVQGRRFALPPAQLVVQLNSSTCIGVVEGWTDQSVEVFLLGSRFISTVYLIYSVTADGKAQVGIAERSAAGSGSESRAPVGAIVGGVVGGVALVAILGGLLFLYVRRRRREVRPANANPDGKAAVLDVSEAPRTGMTSTFAGSGAPLPSPPHTGTSQVFLINGPNDPRGYGYDTALLAHAPPSPPAPASPRSPASYSYRNGTGTGRTPSPWGDSRTATSTPPTKLSYSMPDDDPTLESYASSTLAAAPSSYATDRFVYA